MFIPVHFAVVFFAVIAFICSVSNVLAAPIEDAALPAKNISSPAEDLVLPALNSPTPAEDGSLPVGDVSLPVDDVVTPAQNASLPIAADDSSTEDDEVDDQDDEADDQDDDKFDIDDPAVLATTTFSGWSTTYNPSAGLSACGQRYYDSQKVVAIGHARFDSYPGATANPNKNPVCGKYIKVTNPKNKKSVRVKVVDRCQACGPKDVDLSPVAFAAIFNGANTGKFDVKWQYN